MVRPKKLPAEAVPSEQYGQKAQHLVEQKQVPMADGQVPQGAPGPPASPGGPGGNAPQGGPVPGELGDLTRGTERPDEPLTSGLASGAGGGPEMLQKPDPRVKIAQVLNALGNDVDPETRELRQLFNASLANEGAP